MDVLTDVIRVTGVRATVGATIEAGADWGWWAPQASGAAMHAVTSGTAWVAVGDADPLQLMPGDLVLLPRGDAHAIASDLDAVRRTGPGRCDAYEDLAPGVVAIGTGPPRSRVLCAHYVQGPAVSTSLLGLLPDVLHVRAEEAGEAIQDTVRMLGRELARPGLAGEVVLEGLTGVLLVQLLRAWVVEGPSGCGASWLAALDDPVVGPAMAALHEAPARAWTTDVLAREVAVSRATLARRFPAVLGETPAAYLTRWRMDLAARRLREGADSLEQVAAGVGYTSVHAFSRAFRRAWSQPPGRFRAQART